ncbi:MAG: VOC family protein, partial [Pseudomonadales bacterium]|nr:VOC family protein [Pseudomonadales bacterium]
MTAAAIPEGYHSVMPYLLVNDAARALDYYTRVFGATERLRFDAPGGKIGHAEFEIGDSLLMLADVEPAVEARDGSNAGIHPIHLMCYVADVDQVFQQALASGAKVIRPVQDQFYGDRSGTLVDPFGHM